MTWVILSRDTGAILMTTSSVYRVRAVNTQRYELLTIEQYMERVSK